MLVKGEDPGDFALYRDGMPEELAPAGLMEPLLAERTAGLAWRLRRAERLQAAAFDALPEEKKWAWSDKDNKWLVPQEARESGSWERCPCSGEDDAATNVPEAEEPSCETKPIVKGIGAQRSGIGRLQQSRQARGFD